MEDYKKILQIEVHNIVDRLQNGLIHPYTAKQEIFKSTLKAINYTHSCTELNTDEKEQHFNNGFAQGYNDATNDILSSI